MKEVLLAGILLLLCVGVWAQPIQNYVDRPEEVYGWEVERIETVGTAEIVHLKVTSQTWRDIVWTHRVQLIVPEECDYPETALMLITGGSASASELLMLTSAATMVSAPMVVLGDIPNQPLFDGLTEDALIALTFSNYLETGEEDWPLLFPMTKAAVAAMDAVEDYTSGEWESPINSWVTTGGSKRGWTTWFTGAVVPERLKGIVPMVYDNLNLPAQMQQHLDAWGEYSAMIHDYTERGLPDMLTTEEGRELGAIVDPYTLRHRIDIPQFTISGTNDEYWPLDAANLYWDDLVGTNFILYVPNAGHGIPDMERVINAQVGFFLAATGRDPLPDPSWEFEDTGYLRLTVDPGDVLPVTRVTQWTAHAPTRDFRPVEWTERPALEHRGRYIARAHYPEEGYTAIFAEIVYEVDGREFPLSTNVRIISSEDADRLGALPHESSDESAALAGHVDSDAGGVSAGLAPAGFIIAGLVATVAGAAVFIRKRALNEKKPGHSPA